MTEQRIISFNEIQIDDMIFFIDRCDVEEYYKKMYSVQIHKTITDIKPSGWDRLASDVYMSYGWLKTVEETFTAPVKHRYFIVKDDDMLVGAAVCGIYLPSNAVYTQDDIIFGRFKRLVARFHFSMLPLLICGPLRGYGQHFILDAKLTPLQRETVFRVLLDAIEKEAKRLMLSISFNNVLDDEDEMVQLLKERNYGLTVNFPMNYMDITWESFREYKKMISKRKLVHEINRNRREGVTIRKLGTVEDCEDRLYELLEFNNRKYCSKPLMVRRGFFSRCKPNMGDDANVYIAEKKGKIIGVSTLFHRDGVGYISDVGVDHKTAGNDFTYFNVVFYRIIEDAITMRLNRICYGILFYHMKSRRGCSGMNTYVYYKPRYRLWQTFIVPLFAIHMRIKTWFIRRFYM